MTEEKDNVSFEPENEEKQKKERLSFENRKLEKRLVRRCAEAITDFNMLQDHDKIMVCVSGGKDSYALLDALLRLQGRAPIDFEILAVCLNQHLPDFPMDVIIQHFEKLGVPYHIEDQNTFGIMRSKYSDPRKYCSLCSRLRRGVLYRVAREQKCTKIALGHHLDDVVSTLMLNMFYGGRLKAMPPKLLSDAKEHVIIRPLIYMREKELIRWNKAMGHTIIPKLCGADDLCRREMKEIIARMDRETPGRVENIFKSLMRVAPSHLLDRDLFDFADLENFRSTEFSENKSTEIDLSEPILEKQP